MKKTVFALMLALLAGFNLCAAAAPLSPAIEVIKEDSPLVKCLVAGGKITFSTKEIKEYAGADFDYLTINSLPYESDGVLKVAGVNAVKGQRLSAAGVALLSFTPAAAFADDCSFDFTLSRGSSDTGHRCVIRYSSTPRFAPITEASELKTYEGISVSATLKAYDPDGDTLKYRIERYPTGGSVSIKNGVATYTPARGFLGKDSFSYCAIDDWGRKSAVTEASITVEENENNLYFADMKDDSAHLAAIRMAENDVMTYRLLGESYYFTPEKRLSRIDFAVMLVSAMELELPDKPYPTDIFTDTAEMSRGKRLCLEAAVINGLIDADSLTFRPEEEITVKEAVAMAERAIDEDAKQTIGTPWQELGEGALTKADAAVLLCSVYEH